ncbi:MAG: LrgB family protein [Burkholderiaceae bacterium]|nr:LrgB family protein [Burkholderiaceae bacterium]
MTNFVELWVYLSSAPLFGLTATLAVYVMAQAFAARAGYAAWANPVLWSVVVLAGALLATGTAYPTFFAGAQFIHFLLGPAVVALGWPLWQRRAELRQRWGRLLLAALAGGTVAATSAVGLGWALGLPTDMLLSLAPKSITAPVAMGVAAQIGGVPALAALFAVLTGMVGALSGRTLFKWLGVGNHKQGMLARGFALGTASHGIGAAQALQDDADAGAYAGLALGLQVVLAALLVPLIALVVRFF